VVEKSFFEFSDSLLVSLSTILCHFEGVFTTEKS